MTARGEQGQGGTSAFRVIVVRLVSRSQPIPCRVPPSGPAELPVEILAGNSSAVGESAYTSSVA
jgi:hypothetical protein